MISDINTFFLFQVQFTCIIPHTHFFLYILMFATVLDLIYFLTTLYTLLWLCIRRMRKLSSFLMDYRDSIRRASKRHKWDQEKSTQALDVFGGMKSPDVELLLDLLAETMGIAPAMRILTLLDSEFHTSWRTQQLQQVRFDAEATVMIPPYQHFFVICKSPPHNSCF